MRIRRQVDTRKRVLSPLARTRRSHLHRRLRDTCTDKVHSYTVILVRNCHCSARRQHLNRLTHRINFARISLSRRIDPLVGLIDQKSAAIISTCLSPVLQHCISQITKRLRPPGTLAPRTPRTLAPDPSPQKEKKLRKSPPRRPVASSPQLVFVRSGNKLASTRFFRNGSDVLSKPTKNVIKTIRADKRTNCSHVVNFSVNNASASISRCQNRCRHALRARMTKIQLQTPVVTVRAITTKNNSVIDFSNDHCQIKPRSTKTCPKPTYCHRKKPLTIASYGIVINGLRPRFFPRIFNPRKGLPLSTSVIQRGFATLTARVRTRAKSIPDPRRITTKFLTVTIRGVTGTVGGVSIRQNCSLTSCILYYFNKTKKRRTYLVTRTLNVARIFVRPCTKILSTCNVKLTSIQSLRRRSMRQPLDTRALPRVRQILRTLTGRKLRRLTRRKFRTLVPDSSRTLAPDPSPRKEKKRRLSGPSSQFPVPSSPRILPQLLLGCRNASSALTISFNAITRVARRFATLRQRHCNFTRPSGHLIISATAIRTVNRARDPTRPRLAGPHAAPLTPETAISICATKT